MLRDCIISSVWHLPPSNAATSQSAAFFLFFLLSFSFLPLLFWKAGRIVFWFLLGNDWQGRRLGPWDKFVMWDYLFYAEYLRIHRPIDRILDFQMKSTKLNTEGKTEKDISSTCIFSSFTTSPWPSSQHLVGRIRGDAAEWRRPRGVLNEASVLSGNFHTCSQSGTCICSRGGGGYITWRVT